MMTRVADIMTRDVVTIRNSATVAEAAKLMSQRGVQALIGHMTLVIRLWQGGCFLV